MLGKKGFTLIELLVAMAIIGILAATAIVNFGKNEDRDVRAEKDRLTAYLREVQNKALAGDREGISLSADRKVCGIGVKYDSSGSLQTYFVPTTVAGGLNQDCAARAVANPPGTNYGAVFHLNNGVTISSGFQSSDRLFFLIPDGTAYWNGSASFGSRTINLTKTGLASPIPVTIEQSGRLY